MKNDGLFLPELVTTSLGPAFVALAEGVGLGCVKASLAVFHIASSVSEYAARFMKHSTRSFLSWFMMLS